MRYLKVYNNIKQYMNDSLSPATYDESKKYVTYIKSDLATVILSSMGII